MSASAMQGGHNNKWSK